jgi:AcrR family transcriptional regulator
MNRSSSRESGGHNLKAKFKKLTVDAILDAAEEVFAEHGLSAGMDAIAHQAGVAVGTLYNHFADRQALIAALQAERKTQLLATLDGAMARSQKLAFRPRLYMVLEAMVGNLAAHTGFRKVLLEDPAFTTTHKDKREVGQQLLSRLESLFEQGQVEGQLALDPHGLAPVVFLGVLGSLLHLAMDAPRRLAMAAIPDRALCFFLDGTGKRP